MFDSNYKSPLPGYTGHMPGRIEEDYVPGKGEPRKHIPGKYIVVFK